MISGFLSSISGMLRASRRIDATAHNIANVQTPGFEPLRTDSEGNVRPAETVPGETVPQQESFEPFKNSGLPVPSEVDLTVEMTNLMINQRAFEANAAALKMQDETLGDLFDQSE